MNAKLLIIGRAYAAGIERKVLSAKTQGSSLSRVAQWICSHHTEVDEIIESLPADVDRLKDSLLEPVLDAHGRLVRLLSKITHKSQSTRSFVSKYLHFHRPIVPLFDAFANDVMPSLVKWTASLSIVPYRTPFDKLYYRYVMRLWRLTQQVKHQGLDPSVKELDYYILWEADHAWTSENRELMQSTDRPAAESVP